MSRKFGKRLIRREISVAALLLWLVAGLTTVAGRAVSETSTTGTFTHRPSRPWKPMESWKVRNAARTASGSSVPMNRSSVG